MISLILAAGYATRLYPLTENFPKSLLEVGGRTILDRLIDDLDAIREINRHVLVCNHRMIKHFIDWKARKKLNKSITILDDGSTGPDNRLGAVGDILYAMSSLSISDDVLVAASDNILGFSLKSFIDYSREKGASCVMCYREPNAETLKKCAVALMDDDFLVAEMEEKPARPKSEWAVLPFYIYRKEDIPLIKTAAEGGCELDAPGNLAAWLTPRTKLFAMLSDGDRHDIGDWESYRAAKEFFDRKESEKAGREAAEEGDMKAPAQAVKEAGSKCGCGDG